MSKVTPTQKFGLIDIKQSSKVRPRKLKSWKRRWAVLTKMSNLSSEEYVAKLDLYDNENKWRSNSSDKMTFVLENVTCIRHVKSKTHHHAFEVVENQPVLVMSGGTELESYSWILSLQQIFTPEQIEIKKDCYQVTVSPNDHSRKWNLSGDYSMAVSSTCISLGSAEGTCVISWMLNTLMRFNVEQSSILGQMATLVIECGPHASTGQSCFLFLSEEAQDILGAIRQSICLALAQKENARSVQPSRQRTLSATVSEKNFQKLLEHQSHPQTIPVYRSDSSSSSSTTFGSPTVASKLSCSPASSVTTGHFSTDGDSFIETKEIIHASDLRKTKSDIQTNEVMASEKNVAFSHKRSSSHPDKTSNGYSGYSEIKDAATDQKPVSRRNTLSVEPQYFDTDRIRSVSAVVASLEANIVYASIGCKPLQSNNEDILDLNTAVSSIELPTTNDDQLKQDVLHGPDTECFDGHCPCSFIRRKSSSTPDLQAFWKVHNSMAKYENVYEEIDELRASMQRLNKKSDFATPPELPARPFSIHFTYNTDVDSKSIVTKKQPGLSWYGNPNYEDVKDNAALVCTCDRPKDARSRFDAVSGKCSVCRNELLKNGTETNTDKILAEEKLNKSPFSDVNDINAIILQVQNVKRRRSSDTTPVSHSLLLPPLKSDINTAKSGSLQTHLNDPTRSLCAKPDAQDNFINLQGGTDSLGFDIAESKSIPQSAQSYSPDPLISFFLDSDNFDLSPVVTKEFPVQSSANTGHLIKRGFSFPDVPNSDAASLTHPNRTWTWHGENIGTDSSFGLPVSHPNSLDIWGVNTATNNFSNRTTDVMSGQFSQGPLGQTQAAPEEIALLSNKQQEG